MHPSNARWRYKKPICIAICPNKGKKHYFFLKPNKIYYYTHDILQMLAKLNYNCIYGGGFTINIR